MSRRAREQELLHLVLSLFFRQLDANIVRPVRRLVCSRLDPFDIPAQRQTEVRFGDPEVREHRPFRVDADFGLPFADAGIGILNIRIPLRYVGDAQRENIQLGQFLPPDLDGDGARLSPRHARKRNGDDRVRNRREFLPYVRQPFEDRKRTLRLVAETQEDLPHIHAFRGDPGLALHLSDRRKDVAQSRLVFQDGFHLAGPVRRLFQIRVRRILQFDVDLPLVHVRREAHAEPREEPKRMDQQDDPSREDREGQDSGASRKPQKPDIRSRQPIEHSVPERFCFPENPQLLPFSGLQQEEAENRREREGDEERYDIDDETRDGEGAEEEPHHAAHHRDGQEDDHVRPRACEHRDGHFGGADPRRFPDALSFGEPGFDAFQDNDRVGNEDADGESDREQRRGVHRVPDRIDEQHADHDGDRHRDRDDDRRPYVVQEEEEDQSRKQHALPDVAEGAVVGGLDHAAFVVDPDELHAPGQQTDERVHEPPDFLDDFQGVRVRLLDDPDGDRRGAVEKRRLTGLLRLHFDAADILQVHPSLRGIRYFEGSHFGDVAIVGIEFHGVFRSQILYSARRNEPDPALNGLDDVHRRQPPGGQRLSVEKHLDLPLGSAEQFDVRHAADDGEPVAQLVVRIVVQFVDRDAPRQGQRDDRRRIDVELHDLRLFRRLRQVVQNHVHLRADIRGRRIDVDAKFEFEDIRADVFGRH